MRMVRHWNRVPREAADISSLEAVKVRLDGAVSNLVKQPVPAHGRGVVLDDL